MKLKDTGLTFQDIKDKVNKYMIETYERFDFLAETAEGMCMVMCVHGILTVKELHKTKKSFKFPKICTEMIYIKKTTTFIQMQYVPTSKRKRRCNCAGCGCFEGTGSKNLG